MALARIIQRLNATIEQSDLYELSDIDMAHLRGLPESDREEYVESVGTAVSSSTEVGDIHETLSVEVVW